MTYCSNTFTSAYAPCGCIIHQQFCPNFQSREQQDFSDQHCLTGGRCCGITQLRHLSARVLSACVMQIQFSNSTDFSCPWHSQPNHCLARLAGLLHVDRSHFQVSSEQFSLTGFLLTVSVAFMKPSLVASSLSHKHVFRTVRHSGQLTSTASSHQVHGGVCTLACPGQHRHQVCA